MRYTQEDLMRDESAYIGGPSLAAVEGRGFVSHRHLGKGGKGGGGGSSAYSDYMLEQERQRQRQIAEATAAVNRAFDMSNRQELYDKQRKAVYDLNSAEVERQAEEAERQNRFGLARNGLLGGSADVDATAELNRRTNEGLMNASGIADDAAAKLRSADEATKQNLLSLAQSGISSGDAADLATSQLASNLNSASADAQAASIGDLFGNLAYMYMYQDAAKQAANTNRYLASLYGNRGSSGLDTHNGDAGSVT